MLVGLVVTGDTVGDDDGIFDGEAVTGDALGLVVGDALGLEVTGETLGLSVTGEALGLEVGD